MRNMDDYRFYFTYMYWINALENNSNEENMRNINSTFGTISREISKRLEKCEILLLLLIYFQRYVEITQIHLKMLIAIALENYIAG